jgi:hypothetical protein
MLARLQCTLIFDSKSANKTKWRKCSKLITVFYVFVCVVSVLNKIPSESIIYHLMGLQGNVTEHDTTLTIYT